MNRFSIHDDAQSELIDAATYYESRSPGLGGVFLDEFERAVHQILTYPLSCQLVNRTVRRKVLRRFPYSIMYSVTRFASSPSRLSVVAHFTGRVENRVDGSLSGGTSCQAGSKRY